MSAELPRLGGYRREVVKPHHWNNELVRPKLKALSPSSTDLGDIDLRPHTSPRHNQRSLGSCVAQAVVKALEIKRIIKHGKENHVDLSTLMVYYLARNLMDPKETHLDSGTYISHACDAIRRYGVAEDSGMALRSR